MAEIRNEYKSEDLNLSPYPTGELLDAMGDELAVSMVEIYRLGDKASNETESETLDRMWQQALNQKGQKSIESRKDETKKGK